MVNIKTRTQSPAASCTRSSGVRMRSTHLSLCTRAPDISLHRKLHVPAAGGVGAKDMRIDDTVGFWSLEQSYASRQ